jgi:hypothetical protein
MASFAERVGKRPSRSIAQTDNLDLETRTELWNIFVLLREILDDAARRSNWTSKSEENFLGALWAWQFKKPRDEMGDEARVWAQIKARVLKGEWYDVLDLIEETVKYLQRYEDQHTRGLHEKFSDAFNNRFEHFLVAFRFIGNEVTPVGTTAEAEAVNAAIEAASSVAGAQHSLERATEMFADREKHDYPNSIKESISAVESIVKKVTGKGELSKGLAELERAGLAIHPALRGAWVKMYGWTSDEDGIRHGGIEAADADQALARYVLVTCSAFVSYLTEEGRKTGLLT